MSTVDRSSTAGAPDHEPEQGPGAMLEFVKQVVAHPAHFRRVVVLLAFALGVVALLAAVFITRAPEIASIVTTIHG